MVKKVMVVDDEPAVCKLLSDFLEDKGYVVKEVYEGEKVVEAYLQTRPDVVLLDVKLPGKDGLEVLRELRAIDPKVSVIMVTAVHQEEIAKKAMYEGAFDYITKPINPDYLELSLMIKMALIGGDD